MGVPAAAQGRDGAARDLRRAALAQGAHRAREPRAGGEGDTTGDHVCDPCGAALYERAGAGEEGRAPRPDQPRAQGAG
eukprot:6372351-Prymnesium_polylepis.1